MQFIIISQDVPIGSFSDWDKYGLPGIVIFTLFILFIFFGNAVLKRHDKLESSRSDLINNLLKEHADERKEWCERLEDSKAKSEESLNNLVKSTMIVIKDNTDAISDLAKVIYSNVKGD